MVRRHMAASAVLVAFGVLGVCGSAWAHHGSSAYAEKLTILKDATVTTFQWANPHTIVMFDVKAPWIAGHRLGQSRDTA